MSSVGLLLTGSVLFLDGLLFVGVVQAKPTAVFNLFIGALQVAIPFYLIATAKTPDGYLSAAGVFVFGLTYLFVGVVNLADFTSEGIGWFSLWVAVVAAGFGLTNFIRFHDPQTGLLWCQWSVLWGLFWVVLALGVERLTALAGWMAVIMSFTTATIPGFLLLLGTWETLHYWVVLVAIAATAVALLPVALQADRNPAGVPAAAGALPQPA